VSVRCIADSIEEFALPPEDRGYSFRRNIGNTSHTPHDTKTKAGSSFPYKEATFVDAAAAAAAVAQILKQRA